MQRPGRFRARRGQLDRERQPVQLSADLEQLLVDLVSQPESRGDCLGAITFVSGAGTRTFGPDDLARRLQPGAVRPAGVSP